MDRNEPLLVDDPPGDSSYVVSGDALDALRNSLTVILAQSQVLERRMLRGTHLPPDDYLAALAAIQRSVWNLERQLRNLQLEPTPES